ncbi:DEAD/DEAH box helicase [Georgenia alba]|uniref:DEAD/DEAH box helicase n=1 Tax=Georgenia alba TaxID=2233858 RepID=A0ABW2Q745_9MICO
MLPFSEATTAWFQNAFAEPTAAQAGAWDAVASGEHALVVAPTGSGKTLAAFLWAVDQMLTGEVPQPEERCRVVYVSPLKALAADVERNLRSPLVGITQAAGRLGAAVNDVRVGVRTGDTPASERRRMATHPPDILITTPESLYLVLTSAAREGLRGVTTVIVDEVHAVAGTKRGAHLAVSLERLDAQLPRPAQRVGLSATVRPVPTVATFLAGHRPPADGGRHVRVVQPPSSKELRVDVVVPVEDLADPSATPLRAVGRERPAADEGPDLSGDAAGALADDEGHRQPSVWPHLTERLVDLIEQHRSTIVFTNGRRTAERLTSRINEEWQARSAETSAAAVLDAAGSAWAAAIPGQSGTGLGVDDAAVARAHHGSMSREERVRTESALKTGGLRAVIATSSLELGIDMGAVDLVVQVGSPPSVAAALQRIGRAGHQVGAVSHGVVLPTHRGDLLPSAVAAVRAREGLIEEVRIPANPLDVLAQQVVAMLAVEDLTVAELSARVRRAAPYVSLGERSLTAVLDMLAGRYPSEDFAELRPRIVWDRSTDRLSARPGALRLATTSGGTIPDRGMYGVFLAGGPVTSDGDRDGLAAARTGAVTAASRGRGGRRVGELDEEMVYESRVGDTFTLGTSTWRIEEITPDRVLVSPAPGQPGRLPFWKGDAPGRPVELGRALGATTRELLARLPEDGRGDGAGDEEAAREDGAPSGAAAALRDAGLDDWATANLLGYLASQREATGRLPDDRTIVLERFRDELGDWRVVLHSPFGAPVHAPWAMVLAARLREQTGMDVQAAPSDDGIVLRMPDTGEDSGPLDPAALVLEPSEVSGLVVEALAGSAHFAARFREAAARALLLPRRRPDRRQPLWQQRHRSAQLLSVASAHPDFPVVLEAVRECLQDDFDVPALTDLMTAIGRREIRLVEVTTNAPSPYARTLLMGYMAQFLYDDDAPLAERRAAALALDPALLAELVGSDLGDLADLLDPEAVTEVAASVGLRTEASRVSDDEGVVDLVRRLGPLPTAELAERCTEPQQVPAWLDDLTARRRILPVRVAGHEQWAVLEDAARLRDALGTALPPGLPEAVLEPVPDPLGDLLRRHARTNGPFTAQQVADRFGVGVGAVHAPLAELVRTGLLVEGRLDPAGSGEGVEYCDAEVMRRIRRRSLSRLRSEVEPVPPATLGVFAPRWQHVAAAGSAPELRGSDGLLTVVDQLAGALLPASALESLVLPARVRDYRPEMLDELTAAGEVVWAGGGALPGVDGLVTLLPADAVPDLAPPVTDAPDTPLHQHLLAALRSGGGRFFRDLLPPDQVTSEGRPDRTRPEEVLEALWDLVWAGLVTNDTLAPARARLGAGRPTHASRTPSARPRSVRSGLRRGALTRAGLTTGVRPSSVTPPAAAGRWSLLPVPDLPVAAADGAGTPETRTHRVAAATAALLERHGLLVRGAAGLEDVGFGAAYQVLRRLEESGQVRRGYLVEGLGAAQFALPEVVDRLRSDAAALAARREAGGEPRVHLLAATDPANPYGAALTWPPAREGEGHRPGRKAGSVVVLVDGALVLYVERGGRTLLSFEDSPVVLAAAAAALAEAGAAGRLGPLTLRRLDGEEALRHEGALASALRDAGFGPVPQGLRLRTPPARR